MRFGDRGSLRRAASHLRDEAVATERATRRAGSHLESLVAAAGRYETPSAHALLASWQAPASTFRRLTEATDDAATALDDLARALDRAEEQWTGLVHQATAAGFEISGDGAAVQAKRDLLHLLGHHRRRVQLDHAQRALHLVQVAGAQPHATDVGRVLDVILQLGLGQPQGFVELRLDPAQRGVFEGLAQRSHRFTPRVAACVGLRPVVVAFIPSPGSVLRPAA